MCGHVAASGGRSSVGVVVGSAEWGVRGRAAVRVCVCVSEWECRGKRRAGLVRRRSVLFCHLSNPRVWGVARLCVDYPPFVLDAPLFRARVWRVTVRVVHVWELFARMAVPHPHFHNATHK